MELELITSRLSALAGEIKGDTKRRFLQLLQELIDYGQKNHGLTRDAFGELQTELQETKETLKEALAQWEFSEQNRDKLLEEIKTLKQNGNK
jgi:chromosome segregation ATPase